MKFLGGVELTQGRDRLKSDRLVVNFSDEDRSSIAPRPWTTWTCGRAATPRFRG
jgi:lipopolysaccharide export system protein LptA